MTLRRLASALGLCLVVLLVPSATSWASPASQGLSGLHSPVVVQVAPEPPPPSPTPAPAPASPVTTVELAYAQWSYLAFGLGLLVFLSSASVVAGWRK